jgi:phycoerythrin alpha chain
MTYPAFIPSAMASADAVGRLPSTSDLEGLKGSIRKAHSRLSALEVLTSNAAELSQHAVQSVFDKFPDATKASESLFSAMPENDSHSFKDDISILYRLLAYLLLIGDENSEAAFLDSFFYPISAVLHRSSAISPLWYTEALEFLRKNLGLSGESAEAVNLRIDQVIAAFSGPEDVYDPIAPLIGTLHLGTTDLAENHDRYLSEALERELTPGK